MLTVLRRVFDFSSWYSSHPNEPPPGDMLDASFDAQNQRIAELESLIESIRRSDGALQNGIVTKDAMNPEIYGDLRYEMRFAAAGEALKSEKFTERAEKAAKSAENHVLNAVDAENQARAYANALSEARNAQISKLQGILTETQRMLAELSTQQADLLEVEQYAGYSEAWAEASALWAEHMPDTLPDNALKVMDLTGDHWSSRWWANRAAAAFGQLAWLYMGASPTPPLTTPNGDEIPVGAIYYDTTTGQMYVWNGTGWDTFGVPQAAALMTLWYTAIDGQTVFPFATNDLNGLNYDLDEATPEGVDAHVNGVKVMQGASYDWTLNVPASTVVFQRPLRAGDIVSFDILMPSAKLAPGAVHAWAVKKAEAQDGVRVAFTLSTKDLSGPAVTVSKSEELLVSLDGVIQEPITSYTASGATVTFAQPPEANAWLFMTWFRPT